MTVLKGIIPPIITPMNEDESINEPELRRQVNRLIEAGVHGLFPFGTNGEGYILTEKEKERVLSVVIEETDGRVPVYAGKRMHRNEGYHPDVPDGGVAGGGCPVCDHAVVCQSVR